MYRSNYPQSFDESMVAAARNAALARSAVGSLVVGCILAMAALTACQPQQAAVARVVEPGGEQSPSRPATDPSLDTQLRLDPSEIESYSMNVHG
jgi:hypothetical protein